MYFRELPFQKRSQEIYKKMISKEDNSNYRLSYIEAADTLSNISWVLGYVEENKHIYFFVLHTTSKTAVASNNSVVLLKKILLQQGFLQGLR
jgi:beta-lactamase class D